eukprot:5663307-Lingulodinium_polyedra.AAC.1
MFARMRTRRRLRRMRRMGRRRRLRRRIRARCACTTTSLMRRGTRRCVCGFASKESGARSAKSWCGAKPTWIWRSTP